MTVPDAVVMAAQKLILSLRARPQMHSVWIETGVDSEGEFAYRLCVSIHPNAPGHVAANVPDDVDGYPVQVVPWPSSMRTEAATSELEQLRAEVAELRASAPAAPSSRWQPPTIPGTRIDGA